MFVTGKVENGVMVFETKSWFAWYPRIFLDHLGQDRILLHKVEKVRMKPFFGEYCIEIKIG
jgi:hypothetical protein